ncbi:ATP-NAD kinase-like domain-containing protein [Gaertneriomyces semiglobifer]|nr:ATP-NAD kinase-like domain-containing protein [Gaertneriomyces semiglobifer]
MPALPSDAKSNADGPPRVQLKLMHKDVAKYVFLDNAPTFDAVISAFEQSFCSFDRSQFGIEFYDGDCFAEYKDDADHLDVLESAIAKSDNGRKAKLRSIERTGDLARMEVTNVDDITSASVSLYRKVSKMLHMRLRLQKVRSVVLVTKPGDPTLIAKTRDIALWIIRNFDITVCVGHEMQDAKDFDFKKLSNDDRIKAHLKFWQLDQAVADAHCMDLVITLGGDGTVLYTSAMFQQRVPPVLSFSLGSLGFMTDYQFESFSKALTGILTGNPHHITIRQRLCCKMYRYDKNAPSQQHHEVQCSRSRVIRIGDNGCQECQRSLGEPDFCMQVLNELVLDRGPNPGLLMLELYAGDLYLTTIQADGLVIATATGSTAYSLSAGGSLVHPSKWSMLITPICAHTLTCRPMVLPGNTQLKICVSQNSRWNAWASYDGRNRMELKIGDTVVITTSEYPFPQLCREDQTTDWFTSLVSSLRWNERDVQKPLL